jgi:hypothetical protein
MSLIDKITSAGKSVARKTGLGLATLAAAASLSGNADAGVINSMLYAEGKTTDASHTLKQTLYHDDYGASVGIDAWDNKNTPSTGINPRTIIDGDSGYITDIRPTMNTAQVNYVFDTQEGANPYVVFSSSDLSGFSTDNIHFQEKLGGNLWSSPIDLSSLESNSVTYNFQGTDQILYGIITYESFESENPEKPVSEPLSLFGSALGLYALSKGMKRRE